MVVIVNLTFLGIVTFFYFLVPQSLHLTNKLIAATVDVELWLTVRLNHQLALNSFDTLNPRYIASSNSPDYQSDSCGLISSTRITKHMIDMVAGRILSLLQDMSMFPRSLVPYLVFTPDIDVVRW